MDWEATPVSEAAYLRLLCNPRVVGFAIAPPDALDALRTMRDLAGWVFVPDGSTLAEPVVDVGRLSGTKLVTDFHLVNLAASHQMGVATFDRRLIAALAPEDRHHVLVLTP